MYSLNTDAVLKCNEDGVMIINMDSQSTKMNFNKLTQYYQTTVAEE